MASYFILGLIEIFMLCFNEIKLKGGGLRGCRWGLKGAAHIWWAVGCLPAAERTPCSLRCSGQTAPDAGSAGGVERSLMFFAGRYLKREKV